MQRPPLHRGSGPGGVWPWWAHGVGAEDGQGLHSRNRQPEL